MKEIPLTRGLGTIVDDEDFEWLSEWGWKALKSRSKYYAVRIEYRGAERKRTYVRMHRAILDAPLGLEVDHVNGNSLDNRRVNLRLATAAQNRRNFGLPSHNTSGYKGVHWKAENSKWIAQISVNNQRIYIGSFASAEDAARAYDAAASAVAGEFARLNFPSDP